MASTPTLNRTKAKPIKPLPKTVKELESYIRSYISVTDALDGQRVTVRLIHPELKHYRINWFSVGPNAMIVRSEIRRLKQMNKTGPVLVLVSSS